MKEFKGWAIVTENGCLLFTDEEACIYADFNTALKNKGCHKIVAVTIKSAKHKSDKG